MQTQTQTETHTYCTVVLLYCSTEYSTRWSVSEYSALFNANMSVVLFSRE